jgi:hypothetical protein
MGLDPYFGHISGKATITQTHIYACCFTHLDHYHWKNGTMWDLDVVSIGHNTYGRCRPKVKCTAILVVVTGVDCFEFGFHPCIWIKSTHTTGFPLMQIGHKSRSSSHRCGLIAWIWTNFWIRLYNHMKS